MTRYKINIPKSITFLYINNDQVKFEIKSTLPFTLELKRKYLGVLLTKYVQGLHEANYRAWKKDIQEELNKLRDIPHS